MLDTMHDDNPSMGLPECCGCMADETCACRCHAADEPCRVCPPYVVRCAHLDGNPRVVALIDIDGFAAAANPCPHKHLPIGLKWEAVLGTPVIADCIYPYWPDAKFFQFVARCDAETAFARFEAELLGREVK